MAVGVSDHAEEGEADAKELGGGVSERGSGAHRGGAVRSAVQPGHGQAEPCWCSRRCSI